MLTSLPRTAIALVILGVAACAGPAPTPSHTVSEEGLNTVRLEPDADGSVNRHPSSLTPQDIASLLRGVRAWERRNAFHRLFAGDANRTRAFRDDEIAFLAPAIAKALSQATPAQRVYFHLSQANARGAEETTSGWIFIRDPDLHLLLSEIHDIHPPGPDISRYDRQMPDVPEASSAFNVTFEPEEYLVNVRSGGRWFAPDQREELIIRYRDALQRVPSHPLDNAGKG
jgi:hypothetical protein